MRSRGGESVRSHGSTMIFTILSTALVLGVAFVSGTGTSALGATEPTRLFTVHPNPTTLQSGPPVSSAGPHGMAPSEAGQSLPQLSVTRTLFPGFNATLPTQFSSSVTAWQVGEPAYVPTTSSIWFPQEATPTAGVPAPSVSPAFVFNLTKTTYSGFVLNASNDSAFAFDPVNGLVYAVNTGEDDVTVLNPQTGLEVGSPLPVGKSPAAVVVDPATNEVFVANSGSANLTVISGAQNEVLIGNVPVGTDPVALADDPQDGLVFVANGGSSELSVVSTTSPLSSLSPVPLFYGPAAGVSYSPKTSNVIATIPSAGYATLVHAPIPEPVITSDKVGKGVSTAVVSANGTEFVLGNSSGNNVVVLNASLGAIVDMKIVVGPNVTRLETDPVSGTVFCWTSTQRTLVGLNLTSNSAFGGTPSVDAMVSALAYEADVGKEALATFNESYIYSVNSSLALDSTELTQISSPAISVTASAGSHREYVGTADDLEIFNSTDNSYLGSIPGLTGAESDLQLDSSDNLLWVASAVAGISAVNLSTNSIAFSTGLPLAPGAIDGITLDPAQTEAFVLTSSSSVTVLDARTGHVRTASVEVGKNVTSLVYDPADGDVYAAGDNLVLLNASTLVEDGAPIPIGAAHTVIAETYDPTRTEVFVSVSGLLAGTQGMLLGFGGISANDSQGSISTLPIGEGPDAIGVVSPGQGGPADSGILWVANELSGTVSIVSSPPVIESFVASPSEVDVGQATSIGVSYLGGAGQSTVSFSGLPVGCGPSSGQTVNCTPTEVGTFRLNVTVTDSFGVTANATTTLQVFSRLSVESILSPSSIPFVDVGTAVSATALAFGGDPPYSFLWNFGDGTVVSGQNATHSFRKAGLYAVTVQVTDGSGSSNSTSSAVSVSSLPIATIASHPGNQTDVNLPLEFNGSVRGGTGLLRQSWLFGDGDSGIGANVTHAWDRPGNFTVKYTYVDALGAATNASELVNVRPSLAATFTSENGTAVGTSTPGSTLTFSSTISGGTPPYTVSWTFGDGSSAVGTKQSHEYAQAGTYLVNATVTDAVGEAVGGSLTLNITAASSGSGGVLALNGGFVSGLFLGILLGGVVAAAALFAFGSRRHGRSPPGPVPPYVPP